MNKLENLNSWHADWRGLRVVVFGLGVTGFSVADTLAELGCQVLVIAEKADPELVDILDVIGVTHITGDAAKAVPQQVSDFEPQLVVTSPESARNMNFCAGRPSEEFQFGLTLILLGACGIKPSEWLIGW